MLSPLHTELYTDWLCPPPSPSPYLRVSLEVILLSRLVVPLVLALGSGLASWDGVGDEGGA